MHASNLKTSRIRDNTAYGVLFALPAILGFLIFTLGPMLASLVFSLTDYNVFAPPKVVWLNNYANMFSGNNLFYKSLAVTFHYVLLSVPVTVICAFSLALLLHRKIKGRAVFRTIFYLPSTVPSVASMMIWMWLLNPDLGLVNNILSMLGLPTSLWLYGEKSVIPSIVITGLWGLGGMFVIFLAGLENIPAQYYEALDIDGGNAFHKLTRITIPIMTPTIFFNTVMATINSFQAFVQPYILTQGGPNNASLFYVFYLWREAFRNARMGYACALSWVLFVIVLILTVFLFKTSGKWVYYEGEA